MSVTLCAPDREKSCFACCPPIRPAGYEHILYEAIVKRMLRENTKAFARGETGPAPITGFSCWALGYLDPEYRRVGCLLHPLQNAGERPAPRPGPFSSWMKAQRPGSFPLQKGLTAFPIRAGRKTLSSASWDGGRGSGTGWHSIAGGRLGAPGRFMRRFLFSGQPSLPGPMPISLKGVSKRVRGL